LNINSHKLIGFVPPYGRQINLKGKVYLLLVKFAFPFAFALAYATILASLPLEAFHDREYYLVYAKSSELILARYTNDGWMAVLANEPLWLLINIELAQFQEPDNLIRDLVFIPAFLVSFVLLRNNPKHAFWMIFFLLFPQVLKNYIIHLRQGVAISVFMLGYYAGPKWLRLTLMGVAGFIHSSFLIVAAIGVVIWTAGALRFSPAVRIVLFIASFTITGVLLNEIADVLGARQGAQYMDIGSTTSGIGFLFWLSVLCLFISQGKGFLINNSFPVGVLIFYLSTYFLVPVSVRIFESTILLVMLAGIDLSGWRRQTFLFLIVLYALLTYGLRIDQPWLGWGII